jgi:hypothetical protein
MTFRDSTDRHLLGAMALFIVSQACLGGENWQFAAGALIATGDEIMVLKNAAGRVVSMNGARRVSRTILEDVALWHAVVLESGSASVGSGGKFSTDGPLSTETLTWKLPGDKGASLEIRFDSLKKALIVGEKSFSTDRANLFLIRLDSSWKPTVSQLCAVITAQSSPSEILAAAKKCLPDDASIQKLETYN